MCGCRSAMVVRPSRRRAPGSTATNESYGSNNQRVTRPGHIPTPPRPRPVRARPGFPQSLAATFCHLTPRSVLDVGCGVGTWLAAARRLGCDRCVGLEGAWIGTQRLEDASLDVRVTDLEQSVEISDRFDLAMSLEVAEHLSPQRAGSFVDDSAGPRTSSSSARPNRTRMAMDTRTSSGHPAGRSASSNMAMCRSTSSGR